MMKHLFSRYFLQTNKLSDTFYKFWELLFLDNHSHIRIDYAFCGYYIWFCMIFHTR